MKLSGTCDPRGVLKVCNSGVTSLHYHLGDFSPNCLGLSHSLYDLMTVGQLFRQSVAECSPDLQLRTGIRKSGGGFMVATADPVPSGIYADKGSASRATRVWRWQ